MKNRQTNIVLFAGIYLALSVISMMAHWKWNLIQLPLPRHDIWLHVLRSFGLGCLVAIPVILISYVATARIPAFQNLAKELYKILGPLEPMDIFYIAIFSSIGEELFFRGVLQAWLGLIPASLIFGFLHSGPGKKFLPWTAFAIVVGFILGFVYNYAGDIFAPIGMHFTVNFVNLHLMKRMSS